MKANLGSDEAMKRELRQKLKQWSDEAFNAGKEIEAFNALSHRFITSSLYCSWCPALHKTTLNIRHSLYISAPCCAIQSCYSCFVIKYQISSSVCLFCCQCNIVSNPSVLQPILSAKLGDPFCSGSVTNALNGLLTLFWYPSKLYIWDLFSNNAIS